MPNILNPCEVYEEGFDIFEILSPKAKTFVWGVDKGDAEEVYAAHTEARSLRITKLTGAQREQLERESRYMCPRASSIPPPRRAVGPRTEKERMQDFFFPPEKLKGRPGGGGFLGLFKRAKNPFR